MMVLLEQGVAAWSRVCSRLPVAPVAPCEEPAVGLTCLDELAQDMVRVMTQMVLSNHAEPRP